MPNICLSSIEALLSRPVPVSQVVTPATRKRQIQWDALRLDLLDAEISGNKVYKLLPYLQQAQRQGAKRLLSFGGCHSNHLHALAAVGKRLGLPTIGIVRGYAGQPLTPTLADACDWGMQLHFADKATYRLRYDADFQQQLLARFPQTLLIPEGGAGATGEIGAAAMVQTLLASVADPPDYICLASGTGCSFLGMLGCAGLPEQMQWLVMPALNNAAEITDKARQVVSRYRWQVLDGYQHGGFAKLSPQLARFIVAFQQEQQIALDPVYTAKLFYAINDLINHQGIPEGARVLALHTGGVQGMRGMQAKIERLCAANESEVLHECA